MPPVQDLDLRARPASRLFLGRYSSFNRYNFNEYALNTIAYVLGL